MKKVLFFSIFLIEAFSPLKAGTDPAIVNQKALLLEEPNFQTCLARKEGCQDYLDLCQSEGYSAKNQGEIIFRVLNADLRTRETETNFFQDARTSISFIRESSGTTLGAHEKIFNACVALSAMGLTFESKSLSYYPHITKEPEWNNPSVDVSSVTGFKDQCLNKMPTPEDKGRLDNIIEHFPETYPFNLWEKGLIKRTQACQELAVKFCKSVEITPSSSTVSLVKDCKIEKLPQESLSPRQPILRETLEICIEAHDYPYGWMYEAPVLPADCLKKKRRVKLPKK